MSRDGILLVNLGSPDSTAVSDVRRYLREFLMDERVMDVPYALRFAIVHGFILPFRPRASAALYRKIWTANGSPLVQGSRRLQRKLEKQTGLPVALAMRYGNPAIAPALDALASAGVEDVLVVPLFPHYAMSSYESAVERVKEVAAQMDPNLRLTILPPYYDRPEYIGALAKTALPYLEEDHDHLLFSFHGIPERHLLRANPACRSCLDRQEDCSGAEAPERICYRRHCFQTVRQFAAASRLRRGTFSVSFQSRLGADAWLQPSTEEQVIRLAQSAVGKLLVICPAFTVDCLETIEEIGMRAQQKFLHAGGREFTLIPCLNDQPQWVEALAGMVQNAMNSARPASFCAGRSDSL